MQQPSIFGGQGVQLGQTQGMNIFSNNNAQPQQNTLFNNQNQMQTPIIGQQQPLAGQQQSFQGPQQPQQMTFGVNNNQYGGQINQQQQGNQKEEKDLQEITMVLNNFQAYKRYIDLYRYVLLYQQGDQLERLKILQDNLQKVQEQKLQQMDSKIYLDRLHQIRQKNEKLQRTILDVQSKMEIISFKFGHIDRNGYEENTVHNRMKESIQIINDSQNILHDVNMKMIDYQNQFEQKDVCNQTELNNQQKKYVQDQVEYIYEHLKTMKEAIQQLKIKNDQDEYDMNVLAKEFLNLNDF